jgi:predicted MFS family arabinose efflux permease
MFATGIGFAMVRQFWWLMVVAIIGTMNPSAGDGSLFLPTEQAALSQAVDGRDRTMLFAWYNLAGAFAGAVGALASAVPVFGADRFGWDPVVAQRAGFAVYAVTACVAALLYRPLSSGVEVPDRAHARHPLAKSRRIVFHLAALFSLDALGGGFVIQSLLVLWLYRRFDLSPEAAGALFFVAGLLGAGSQLVAGRLAGRIGLVRTMVYTHLPSSLLLVLTALMPTLPLALTCLLLRTAISQMDVPARQSYVMAMVPPEERGAASSVTNAPRSLAAAATPLVAGAMLDHTSFGWPLICAGGIKVAYDLLLLAQFRSVPPLDG